MVSLVVQLAKMAHKRFARADTYFAEVREVLSGFVLVIHGTKFVL